MDVISDKCWHQDPVPDHFEPLWMAGVVDVIPEVVQGDHHGTVFGGVVQNIAVVMVGDYLTPREPSAGDKVHGTFLF